MKRVYALAALLVGVSLLVMPCTAAAVAYGGVGGRPANPQPDNPRTQSIFIYKLAPGQSVTDGIRVFNSTNEQQDISLYGVDSVLSSGGAFACAQNADPKHDVGSWIQLSSSVITLAPNSSQVVPFTVTVPTSNSLAVGEHDGCLTMQAASETAKDSNQGGVVLSFRSAIRVAVTIPGNIIKQLDITGATVGQAKDGNYVITPTLKNSGNVSLDTTLHASLDPILGIYIPAGKNSTTPLLPHSEAIQTFEIPHPFWGGVYRVHITASYNNNPSTELGSNQDQSQQIKMFDSAAFFAAPTIPGVVIELAAVLIIIGVPFWLIRRKLVVKHLHRRWEKYTVNDGDTIEHLAKQFHLSWKKIATVNRLKPPYTLRSGQEIKLPSNNQKG